jgi:hypothetical protein
LVDSSDIVLQHNMDIIKVECDPDIEAHAASPGGETVKQILKGGPMNDRVTISMQRSEVQDVILLDVRLASMEIKGGGGQVDTVGLGLRS